MFWTCSLSFIVDIVREKEGSVEKLSNDFKMAKSVYDTIESDDVEVERDEAEEKETIT